MKKLCILFVVLPLVLAKGSAPQAVSEPLAELHRSPLDVTILPGGTLAISTNHTSDSISLVDLVSGQVLAEYPCGRRPAGVACSRDGKRVVVSNLWSGTLTLFEALDNRLRCLGELTIGSMPRGVVFAPNGESLFVALGGTNEVVQAHWTGRKVVRRWSAPKEPRNLAITKDGRFLAAVSTRSAEVRCWDTTTGEQCWERRLDDAFNVQGLAFSPDETELITAHIHNHQHMMTKRNIEEGWALNSRLARLTREASQDAEFWQLALDIRHKAVGDPCAVAFSSNGEWLAATAAGTHELLVFRAKGLPWSSGGPGDFLDSTLDSTSGRFRRVMLGGRPLAVQFIDGSPQAVVANYLLDALQVVDVQTGELVRTIPLGGPKESSLARQGEAIFYDAMRSHHQWFSCHTCHTDGHTCGRAFDTLNDDSYGNAKLTPTLRGVTKTGPWTWHGWQQDLGAAVEKSLVDTLFGEKPSSDEVKAVLAFLGTLDHPPSPYVPTQAAERGKAIFQGKANCVRCHQGETFTSRHTYDVKLEHDGSPFDRWNPPSLRGVFDRGPFMHEGKIDSLDEVLRGPHAPEKLGGKSLTPSERADLIEFLKTL